MDVKKIYVCCGTGVATSTIISKKLQEALNSNKINFKITQGRCGDARNVVKANRPHLIVSSADIKEGLDNVPVILGHSFLTGLNQETTVKEILEILENS